MKKTLLITSGDVMDVFDAAERYKLDGKPLIILAGKEYGSGKLRSVTENATCQFYMVHLHMFSNFIRIPCVIDKVNGWSSRHISSYLAIVTGLYRLMSICWLPCVPGA